MSSSAYRHVVTLDTAGAPALDDAGGYTEPPIALVPATWHCSIAAATARDLERVAGGVVSATATHILRGRYHAQLSEAARITFGDRVFDVESVHDRDERQTELEVIARERLIRAPVAPAPPVKTYAEQVVADGASHYWRLDELGGTFALDTVEYAHGTLAGGVSLNQPGALADNPAMAFDGTGQIVTTVPIAIPLTTAPGMTVEAWIKTGAASSIQPTYLSMRGAETGDSGPTFFITSGGRVSMFTQWIGPTGIRQVDDSFWHHVVWVFDPTGAQLFLDATRDTQTSETAIAVTTAKVRIGFDGASVNPWIGAVDEVALYPYALSAAQIAAHYEASGRQVARARRDRPTVTPAR